jgi:hypothetical protein
MAHWKSLGSATVAALGVFAMANGTAAQFVVATGKLPATGGRSENIDFADVDLDGDWDAAIADGGDFNPPQQNRLYINQGGLQGGTKGVYLDGTAARLPSILDQSRDIEFVDFDNDGDADIYVSNTAQLAVQGNRWQTNLGGKQGGTLGFYQDETAVRWVGLGGPGSSIAPSQVLGDGTFIDWSCDCDFGDMDNDGDLDLFHGTYGGAFGGQVPTRLFLNDGDGHFSEWNPSGFQLPIATISAGNPGLWCEGVHQSNTTNTTGQFCDIASSALDIDVGDIDGDFDLDLLHGARQEAPRMFMNRLDGTALLSATGTPIYRDVTAGVFPSGWSSGNGHYEQEMADLDFDGDLDIYGLNWQVSFFNFNDITLQNDGDGTYSNLTVLTGSGSDDNEGDFFDYDNDGDLDLYVANFSGQDKLYRNNSNGTVGSFDFTKVSLPSFGATSLDADCADVDGDGDYDVIISEDGNQHNTMLENITQTPDTHGPYLPNIEDIGNQTAAAGGNPVRVHVYDNAPYYITWYNPTVMNVSVDGVDLPAIPALSSAGQIFRGVLPANLVGSVEYGFTSEDEYGNSGSSSAVSITGSTGLAFQTTYGSGTSGLSGGEPILRSLSVPFTNSTAYLAISSGAAPGTSAIMVIATSSFPTTPIGGILTLNVGGTLLASISGSLDANGDMVVPGGIPSGPSGAHLFAQGFVLDSTGSQLFASSKGLDFVIQ